MRSVVVEMLAQKPDAKPIGMVAHMENEHGLKVSESTVSRARQDLGLAPDCQQSRAGKAKKQTSVVKDKKLRGTS